MDPAILSLSFLPATLDRSHAKLPTKAVFILSLLRARWCCQSKHTSELFSQKSASARLNDPTSQFPQLSACCSSVPGSSVPKAKYRLEPQGGFFGGRGTFSVRWNAEGDNPPVDVKYGDGRFNYYTTNLYGAKPCYKSSAYATSGVSDEANHAPHGRLFFGPVSRL